MTQNEKTGNVWIMNYRILIIAGIVLLCLLPVGVQAADDSVIISAKIEKTISISYVGPYPGTWNLIVGPNAQNYGDLAITTNADWHLTTSTTDSLDGLKHGAISLAVPLLLNGGNVTAFTASGTISSPVNLPFSQVVTMGDRYYDTGYGTTVTFTVMND